MKSLVAEIVNVEQVVDQVPIGAHLMTSRRFYRHHGIYLGDGKVAHYAGFSGSLKPGPVEVTDLVSFANGQPVWRLCEACAYSRDEIVNRARSRIGECQYRILSNNCEHFCTWCISGKSDSAQVNAFLYWPRVLLSLISNLKPHFVA